MAQKSMAELVYTAYLTGTEAEFYDNGITYTFTPEGLKDYISATTGGVSSINGLTGDVTLIVLTEAQKNAIDALVVGASTADDIITALQAV